MTIDTSTPLKVASALEIARTSLSELQDIAVQQTLRHTEVATAAALGHLATAQLWALEALRVYLEDGD